MSIDTNDPRLTSYALGEMSTRESTAFEAELATDPAALAEVEAIRSTAGAVQTELQTEDASALAPEQRAAITNAKPRRPIYQMWLPWATIAASIVVVVALSTGPEQGEPLSPAGNLHAQASAEAVPFETQWMLEGQRRPHGEVFAPATNGAAGAGSHLRLNG